MTGQRNDHPDGTAREDDPETETWGPGDTWRDDDAAEDRDPAASGPTAPAAPAPPAAPDADEPVAPDADEPVTATAAAAEGTPSGMRPSAGYIARRSVREFSADGATDLAAALTYYAVLSVFPALVALVSLPAVVGRGDRTTDELLRIVEDSAPASVYDRLSGPIEQLADAPAAGVALIIGLAAALWTASGYVGAFGRAMNRIYGVAEGRPFWILRPTMLGVTLLTMLLVLAALVLLVVTGPLAQSVGDTVGVGDTAVAVWNVAKWPALLLIVIVIIAVLYGATPNVKQRKFRWLSTGAAIAIAVWAVASAGFGFYVANFGSYDETYGSLAGVIVFLLWLWLTNVALLFGAEVDVELERARELEAGEPAEERVQLPHRSRRGVEKAAAKRAEAVRLARRLRGGRAGRGERGPAGGGEREPELDAEAASHVGPGDTVPGDARPEDERAR